MIRPVYIRMHRACGGFSQGIMATLFMCLLAIGGVSWVGLGMIAKEQWPVRWLEVDGAFERVSSEQIRASLVPVSSGSFFTVDLDAIREAVYRQPWVETAAVQKIWPDTIKVNVREFTPVAHWTGDRLISLNGATFEIAGAADIQGLPYLSGPDEQLEVVFENWQQINNELLTAGLEIELIRLDPRGSWFLELNNGTGIHMGREHARSRLKKLVGSWAGLMDGKELPPQAVDLRYTNGFAVRWATQPARLAGNYGKEN